MADQPTQAGAPSEDERELARNRTTFLLMVGGAISLLIPLLGVGYMHYRDLRNAGPTGAGGTAVFEHRAEDAASAALTPAATPAPDGPGGRLAQVPNLPPRDSSPAPMQPNMANQQGGSLSFIRASADYTGQQPAQQQAAAAPAQAPAQPPPQQQAPPAPEPQAQASVAQIQQKKPSKPAYKPFNMPHLKASGFGGSQPQQMAGAGQPGQPGGQGMPGGGNPAAAMAAMQQMGGQGGGAGGMPNMGALMQGMGGGQGGAGGAGGAGGMPNMGAVMQQMQNMPGAAQGAAGGVPNMGAMMQQMQQQGQQH